MKISSRQITSASFLLADGAWGTELQKLGLSQGSLPEEWNLRHPERVLRLAKEYVDAGAEIILTNTLGGNKFILGNHGLEASLTAINLRGAEISRQAAGDDALVFGSMGPTGKLLMLKNVTEEEIFDTYRQQAEALWRGGVDALCIETMVDAAEMRIAARAARESTPLPLVLSMTFDTSKKKIFTMMGLTPERVAAEMEAAGAWMVGANCGAGPEFYVEVCRRFRASTEKPIWIKANAGIPQVVGGAIIYPDAPERFGEFGLKLRDAGANVVGGCCGTTPAHIRYMSGRFKAQS